MVLNSFGILGNQSDNQDSLHLARSGRQPYHAGFNFFSVTAKPLIFFKRYKDFKGGFRNFQHILLARTFIFNYFIVLSKRHVFLSKIDGNSPDICLFLETLKDKLTILRSIANSKGQQVKFKHIWKPLLSIAQI